jgi:hypothetical protein
MVGIIGELHLGEGVFPRWETAGELHGLLDTFKGPLQLSEKKYRRNRNRRNRALRSGGMLVQLLYKRGRTLEGAITPGRQTNLRLLGTF